MSGGWAPFSHLPYLGEEREHERARERDAYAAEKRQTQALPRRPNLVERVVERMTRAQEAEEAPEHH